MDPVTVRHSRKATSEVEDLRRYIAVARDAIEAGRVEDVEFLMSTNSLELFLSKRTRELFKRVPFMPLAAASGSIEMVEYLRQVRGERITTATLEIAKAVSDLARQRYANYVKVVEYVQSEYVHDEILNNLTQSDPGKYLNDILWIMDWSLIAPSDPRTATIVEEKLFSLLDPGVIDDDTIEGLSLEDCEAIGAIEELDSLALQSTINST